MRACKLVLLIILVFGIGSAVERSTPPQQPQSQLVEIISNPNIWRKDFRSVLKAVSDWKKTGEIKITVYTDRAEGARKFDLLSNDALKEASELHLLMKQGKSKLKPEFQSKLNAIWNSESIAVSPTAQPVLGVDQAAVVLAERGELLSVGLTPEVLKQQIGEPESISTVAIDTGDERRPVILTLYHYAGGSIVFAVPDMSRTPGIVDRAFLDTQKISELIFRP